MSCHIVTLVWIRNKKYKRFYQENKLIALKAPKAKLVGFANSVDLDEVAHNEPPHLDLHCLP